MQKPKAALANKIKISTALIAPFVLLIFLSVGLVQFVTFHNSRTAVNNVAGQLRRDISLRIENQLHLFLKTPRQINQTNADAMRQGELDINSQHALTNHFRRQSRFFRSVTSIYFGNTRGGLAGSGFDGAGNSQYITMTPGFAAGPFNKYSVDSRGQRTELLATVPDFDARQRQWYKGAVENGGGYWCPPYSLFTGQDLSVSASLPVYDEQHALLGVVSIDIFLSHLSRFLKSLSIGKTGEAFIMERSGLLIAASTNEPMFTESGNKQRLNAAQSRDPLIRRAIQAMKQKRGGLDSFNNGAQHLEFQINGKTQFLDVLPVRDDYGLDWLVVVVIPESDFLQTVNANNRKTHVIILFVLLIALGLCVVIAKGITGPIIQLNDAANALARGKWIDDIRNNDRLYEISNLINAFNQMARNLRQTQDGLNTEIAERDKAEQALLENQRFLSELIENQGALIFVKDRAGRYELINKKWEESTGLTRDKVIGKTDEDLFPGAVGENFRENDIQVMERGEPLEIEEILESESGRKLFISIKIPLRDNSGAVRGICGIATEITQRKLAEEALFESEERLAFVLDGSQLGFWDWDIETGTVKRNERWAEMLGYTLEEIEFSVNQWTDLHHPDDRAAAWKSIQDHLDGRTPVHKIEYRMLAKDGRYRWILDQARVVKRDKNGKPLRMSGTHTDITERKQAAETLAQSERYYRDLITSLQVGVVVHNADTSIKTANETAEAILGLDIEQMIGKKAIDPRWQFVREDGSTMSPEEYPVNKVLSTRKPVRDFKFGVCIPENEQTKWVLVSAYPVIKGDKIQEVVVTFPDITNLTQAETDKANLQQQLLQSQKMDAIGQLAGGIAHDFNNMLAVIMGNANLMQITMKPGDEGYLESKEIMDAAHRARDLTLKLLTLSRREKLNVRNIDIAQLIQGLVSMLQRSIDKSIQITTTAGADIVVKADQNQLEQALMNICMNARDAMPDGGRLTIACQSMDLDEHTCKAHANAKPGKYCMINVADTGTGMPADVIQKILEPFFTTKGPGKGTGLGLSVTHGIITSHEGFMDIFSEPGKGTTVTVYIPLAPQGEVQIQAPAGDEIRCGTETILVVDDEAAVLRLAERIFQTVGYTVYKADTGAEALEIYREHRDEIALVVLDMIMPEMDGTAVFKKLKALNPSVKIVLSSGYSADGKASDLMAQGASAFVQKPFVIASLCNTVRRVIDS